MAFRERRLTKTPPPAIPEPSLVAGGPPEPETGGVVTVDLSAICANWRALLSRVSPAECSAVVKADAYGCGLEAVVGALARSGCKTFFVAHLFEARRVRAVAPQAIVYVLNGIAPGSASAFADAYARPVISSMGELAEWDAFCSANNWRWGAALHIDTGMNRLGLSPEETMALTARTRMPDHGISLVMSHFACADTPEHPLNDRQIQVFRELRLMFRGITASLANSAGIFLGAATHCDLVRPGIALYGANPTPGYPQALHPVVELKARIAQIRTVPRGATVGYGAAWTAPTNARIAIVSAGYADGYLRAVSGSDKNAGAEAIVAEHRCRIVGRISMDLLAVDITTLPDNSAKRGDWVTLIGGDITVDEFAAWGGTISYEILTNLGRRYHRTWKSGAADPHD